MWVPPTPGTGAVPKVVACSQTGYLVWPQWVRMHLTLLRFDEVVLGDTQGRYLLRGKGEGQKERRIVGGSDWEGEQQLGRKKILKEI